MKKSILQLAAVGSILLMPFIHADTVVEDSDIYYYAEHMETARQSVENCEGLENYCEAKQQYHKDLLEAIELSERDMKNLAEDIGPEAENDPFYAIYIFTEYEQQAWKNYQHSLYTPPSLCDAHDAFEGSDVADEEFKEEKEITTIWLC